MDILFIVGRILLGGFFLMTGLNHFLKLGFMTGYAESKGVPSPKLAVIVGGLLLLAGGAGIVLGVLIPWSVAALLIFLIPVSFKMHNFWAVPPEQKMPEMVNFMKNMALIGALLMILLIADWPYSLN